MTDVREGDTSDLTDVTAEDLAGLSEGEQRDLVLGQVRALLEWAQRLDRRGAW